MANEITAHCYPGLSMQVRLMQGATAMAAAFAMTEAAAQPGYYTADQPAGLADGAYTLLLINGGQVIGQQGATVRGGVFVDAAVLADIPPAVRTNLATELARLDVATSTRASPGAAMTLTPAERAAIEAQLLNEGDSQAFVAAMVAAIGNQNVDTIALVAAMRSDIERGGGMLATRASLANIEASTVLAKEATSAAIRTKTDALPAAPAAVSDIPTAAAVAAAVRADQATELGRIDAAISTRESEASAAARAAAGQAEHDATQVGIAVIAAIGDPLNKPVPGTYPAGSAGEALGKLVVGPPDEPAIVLPGAPAASGICRVYGYLESADNLKLPNVTVQLELLPANVAVGSERLVAGRKVTLKTDAQGRLIGPTGDPWVDLQRTDLLAADGSAEVYYEVTSTGLGVHRRRVALTTATADLRTLLITPAAP